MKQDIDQVSAIQRYPIGLSYPVANPLDLRRFHYARAGAALVSGWGAFSVVPQICGFDAIALAAEQGDRQLTITVGATDGLLGDGVIAEDYLAGGYVVIFTPAPMQAIQRMIVANTAQAIPAGVGGPMTLTLDKPLSQDIDILNFHAECMANPYMGVQTGTHQQASVVGVPTMPVPLATPFCWLQTWGPLWLTPTGIYEGLGNANRVVVFVGNGSIADEENATSPPHGNEKNQHAGFVLPNLLGGAVGAPFIFLQITP